jgi:hypothetical protein
MSQTENVAVATPTQEVLKITISAVLDLLAQGKNRKEIADYYGRTQTEMQKIVWSHPKLKGRKIKKQYTGIELEDDTEDINDVAEVTDTVTDTLTEEVAHVPAPETSATLVNGEMVGSTDSSDWN